MTNPQNGDFTKMGCFHIFYIVDGEAVKNIRDSNLKSCMVSLSPNALEQNAQAYSCWELVAIPRNCHSGALPTIFAVG